MIKLNNKKGFTLIELMIVIAIIGILAAIAIPNFISYRNKAFCSKAESDASSVQAAMASYFSEPNNVTVTKTKLDTSSDRPILNPSNSYALATNGIGWKITVTDATNRCPRGTNHLYVTYFGTSEAGGWN
jgi:prepilin-type N-terminal cleavage/methylation domain-containing protein